MGRKKNETLASFVQALQGLQVIVELRYDIALRGVLESVDDAMNLVMTDVKCQPLQGKATDLDFMFVKGRHIRYIHIPKSVRPSTAIEERHLQVAAEKRMHALQQGPLARRPKGDGGAAVDDCTGPPDEDVSS